jgi:sRNA-binding regulator protein Hfq
LIRPSLTDVKNRQTDESRVTSPPAKPVIKNSHSSQHRPPSNSGKPSNQPALKKSPPQDTNAEIFYYKKQIEGHVPMVIILQDGEKVLGTIEWYDRHALKINREGEPNIMLLKHNIKYMYKDTERS